LKKHRFALAAALLLTILVASFACNKYNDTTPVASGTIPPEQTVTASLQGRVLDENGLPVQGAAVASGAATATTDVNGVFTFSNISLSSRFGYVTVKKQGYFTGSRSILTKAGSSNYVSIQLIPRVSKGMFAASNGGVITVGAGDTVAFAGASVVTAATNVAYTGNVHVFGAYLDPTDVNLFKYMPGDLRGIGKDGKETSLQSFGMMAVELEGDGGEKLQIAAGQEAALSWAIPASLQATAPGTIPLWYFNDSTGRWIEQGTATRRGNNYIAQVGHFSYWNCDAPVGTVNFDVHLKDQHGNPVAYAYVQFQSESLGVRGGYTDSSGYAHGMIPKGQSLLLQVVSDCGSMLAGMNVGPALSDQDLGTIVVTIDHAELTLTGTVVDCYNNPVTNGYVNAYLDGLNYRAMLVNGAFTLPVSRCFSTSVPVALTAVDLVGAQQNSKTITASTGDVDAGQLSACGVDITQFVNFSIDGASYSITTPPDKIGLTFSLNLDRYMLAAQNGSNYNPIIYFRLPPMSGPGSYSLDSMNVSPTASSYYYQQESMPCTITTFGPVNGFIEGSFSGPVYQGNISKIITGTFKVLRTQ